MNLIQPNHWSLVRKELERIISDTEWHPVVHVRGQLSAFVDPRLAARLWYRSRGRGLSAEDCTEYFRTHEHEVLAWGRRWSAEQLIREQIQNGRLEARGQRVGRRNPFDLADIRLAPGQPLLSEFLEAQEVCSQGHPRPAKGWPGGQRRMCLACARVRYARRRARAEAAA